MLSNTLRIQKYVSKMNFLQRLLTMHGKDIVVFLGVRGVKRDEINPDE